MSTTFDPTGPDATPATLSIGALQDIFGFTSADLIANRQGSYSFGQHRLVSTGIGLCVFAVLVVFTWPFQREAGRIFGIFGGLCFGALDLVALMAGVAGLGALWNTLRESRQSPLQTFTGLVRVQQNKDESFALTSEAFNIPLEQEAAERFVEGVYTVYFIPKFVNDRDNLFSIEPAPPEAQPENTGSNALNADAALEPSLGTGDIVQ